jgi:UDP-N-acetyl-D-mannosaminuronic acid dehydrogenase
VEPHIKKLPDSLSGFECIELSGIEDALVQADVVALLVNHRAFLEIKNEALIGKIVIDTRGIFEQVR